MWARITTFQFPVDAVDLAIQEVHKAIDAFHGRPGLVRIDLYGNRKSGAAITISLCGFPEADGDGGTAFTVRIQVDSDEAGSPVKGVYRLMYLLDGEVHGIDRELKGRNSRPHLSPLDCSRKERASRP